ncbi:sodium:proton exchanger [Actinophytocola sp.]|uniref:sodium:calcium antiporter n=1 Tax=Actinophytocola sp. TaxID=1872138 RepID=UPI002ED02D73
MEAMFVFVSGAALLIYSAERLIGHLVRVASSLNISVFLLAIVFTGIEFDDVFLGVALNLEDLGGVALGTVFGTALSLIGVVLALAAILTPTAVRVPRAYLVIFAAAPLTMIAFALTAPLGAVDGVVLLGVFVLFIAYVVVRESRAEKPVFRDEEMYEALTTVQDAEKRSGWTGLGMAVLAIGGLVVGSATTGIGTRGILETYGLNGTVFGATIATLVLTVEDVFLTVEPARRGAPEIGVGNVIGSVVFSVTGKLGIILLTGGLVVGQNVLSWHLPALIVLTGLAAYFLSTGQLRRWHGFVLLGLYAAYWIVSFGAFGEIPAEMD